MTVFSAAGRGKTQEVLFNNYCLKYRNKIQWNRKRPFDETPPTPAPSNASNIIPDASICSALSSVATFDIVGGQLTLVKWMINDWV